MEINASGGGVREEGQEEWDKGEGGGRRDEGEGGGRGEGEGQEEERERWLALYNVVWEIFSTHGPTGKAVRTAHNTLTRVSWFFNPSVHQHVGVGRTGGIKVHQMFL